MPDLYSLLERLIRQEVDFVVIGGFAGVAHGSTFVTQDIDICCDMALENLMRLQGAVADLNPVHRMTPARVPLHLTPENCTAFKNLYLDTDCGQLDCLGSVQGLGDFEAVSSNSVEIELSAGTCRVLSLDALIRAKEAMPRPRDEEAVMELKAIRRRRQRN